MQSTFQVILARAAAIAAAMDFRPLSFTDNKDEMAFLLESVFKLGQSILADDYIVVKSYIPKKDTVKHELQQHAKETRAIYMSKFLARHMALGRAMSVDGLTLKIQGKHYYDLTLHYFVEKPCIGPNGSTFVLKNDTRLLQLGPANSNAENIRANLKHGLSRSYGLSLDDLSKTFTMVTDGAAVMARAAGSSVSRNIAPLYQRWMRCTAHMLNIL